MTQERYDHLLELVKKACHLWEVEVSTDEVVEEFDETMDELHAFVFEGEPSEQASS